VGEIDSPTLLYDTVQNLPFAIRQELALHLLHVGRNHLELLDVEVVGCPNIHCSPHLALESVRVARFGADEIGCDRWIYHDEEGLVVDLEGLLLELAFR
jgi:hypothetical protein